LELLEQVLLQKSDFISQWYSTIPEEGMDTEDDDA
jgi:hypothetical protein